MTPPEIQQYRRGNMQRVKPNFIRTNFIFTKLIEGQTFTGNGCNAIIFINNGAAPVQISGITLNLNQSIALNGNSNDQDYTVYDIRFLAAAGRDLNIVQKFNTYE